MMRFRLKSLRSRVITLVVAAILLSSSIGFITVSVSVVGAPQAKVTDTYRDLLRSHSDAQTFDQERVRERATRVAQEVHDYLKSNYPRDLGQNVLNFNLCSDKGLREVALQKDGDDYTAMYASDHVTIVHKRSDLICQDPRPRTKDYQLASWREIYEQGAILGQSEGFYLWRESPERGGKLTLKYMACRAVPGTRFIVAATAYVGDGQASQGVIQMGVVIGRSIEGIERRLITAILVGAALVLVLASAIVFAIVRIIDKDLQRTEHEKKQTERYLRLAQPVELAHDLKNDIFVIETDVDELCEELARSRAEGSPPSAEIVDHFTRRVPARVRAMRERLQNVLRMQRQKRDRKPLDMAAMLRDQYPGEILSPLLREKRIEFHVHGLDDPLWVDGTEFELKTAIDNLLTNALHFTPEKGRIQLNLERANHLDKAYIKVVVLDSGKGFTNLDRVREGRFYTGRADAGGTGLGLSIVERITIEHGGFVTFDNSERIGCGAEVTMMLPELTELPPS